MKKRSKFKKFQHPSFTEIVLLFVELEEHDPNSYTFRKILDKIATKLYYIPSTLVQPYTWSDSVDDMHSAGLEGLAKAISRYDHKKNNNFFLYSYRAIKGEIHREQKREMKWVEVCKTSSPVEEFEDILPDDGDPEQKMIREETLKLLVKLVNSLDKRSKTVMSMYLGIDGEPRSLRYIAEHLGVCHETARKIRDDATDRIAEVFRRQT